MPKSFLSLLPLSRFDVDRDHVARERIDLLDELWADPSTRVLPVHAGSALLSGPSSLALLPVASVPKSDVRVYLGRSTSSTSPEPVGTPIVAVELSDVAQFVDGRWANLRQVGHSLSDRDAGLLTQALGILNWHATHQFSPSTGQATIVERGGWVRRDPIHGGEVFPRTDPAIIVGITDDADRMLLGSNALWESNRYSLLAGFVEPGESLEAAVVREVFEESGIRVVDPAYLGSQPWPFPASLMLGFSARVEPGSNQQPVPDGKEIVKLRWFSREDLSSALSEIRLPGRTSIARAIIEQWFGEPIDDGQR